MGRSAARSRISRGSFHHGSVLCWGSSFLRWEVRSPGQVGCKRSRTENTFRSLGAYARPNGALARLIARASMLFHGANAFSCVRESKRFHSPACLAQAPITRRASSAGLTRCAREDRAAVSCAGMSAKEQERRARTWAWTIVALLLIGVSFASRWRSVTWVWTVPSIGSRSLQVGDGALRLSRYTPYVWVRDGWHVQPCPDVIFGWPQVRGTTPTLAWRLGWRASDIPKYGKSTAVSLLYPVVLTTGPALVLWILHLRAIRRDRLGHCRKCGYDLRGLAVGAACPECGVVSAQEPQSPGPSPAPDRQGQPTEGPGEDDVPGQGSVGPPEEGTPSDQAAGGDPPPPASNPVADRGHNLSVTSTPSRVEMMTPRRGDPTSGRSIADKSPE